MKTVEIITLSELKETLTVEQYAALLDWIYTVQIALCGGPITQERVGILLPLPPMMTGSSNDNAQQQQQYLSLEGYQLKKKKPMELNEKQ